MNYFGLFFTFMIPGIFIGLMAAYVVRGALANLRASAASRQSAPSRKQLYVCDLRLDGRAECSRRAA